MDSAANRNETVRASAAMVCSVDRLASEAGVAMLRAGGTAADAAVATSAVLAVTTQHMCGMGGDLLAVVAKPGDPPVALNASGRAGSGADAERLRSEGHRRMPLRNDIRSVPVPGCVDGWMALHERFGRLPRSQVLEPAERLAHDGFPASPTLAASLPAVAHLDAAADYRAAGTVRAGTVIRRPGVARALAAVAADGRAGFYQGEFGAGLIELGHGEYRSEDLDRCGADWVEALHGDAWGHRIWTVPPNSQGYLTAAGAWLASSCDLPSDAADPRWAHLLIEAARQAAYDRVAVLHEHADGAALVAPARLEPRRVGIDPERAAGLGGTYGPGGTIALCCVDAERMGVCLVQSNAAGFGSFLAEPASGIFLHNRGIGFSLEPGHPAGYGPGRRPPHTLCPTVVTDPRAALVAVLGTMGGDSQPQILLQLLARRLAGGEEPGEAVAAGRWALSSRYEGTGFDTWAGRGEVRVLVEGHAPPAWDGGLTRRGHLVERVAPFSHSFGHAHLIVVEGGELLGGTDPRPGVGAAIGL
jgi:gamma-glutamyltranspeptidase/glutathione hydrolase